MKKGLLVLLLLLVVCIPVSAELPTEAMLGQLYAEAQVLHTDRRWVEAAEAYGYYVEKTDEFIDLLLMATRPLTMQATSLTNEQLDILEEYLELASLNTAQKNMGLYLQAHCYHNGGMDEEAVKALDSLFDSLTHSDWWMWTNARKLLSEILDLGLE